MERILTMKTYEVKMPKGGYECYCVGDGRNRWTPINGSKIIKTVFKKYKNASYEI